MDDAQISESSPRPADPSDTVAMHNSRLATGNDIYDRWRNYHEQFLRPKYIRDIETDLQRIAPDLNDGLYEQVKAKVLAYISELADHQNKPVVMLLIKAGMVKRWQAKD